MNFSLKYLRADLKKNFIFIQGHFSIDLKNFYVFKHFLKECIYLFLERGEGREKERERNTHVCFPLTHPLLGTWPTAQSRARLGIKPVTLWFTGQHSIHWATPARAFLFCFVFVFLRERNIGCPLYMPRTGTKSHNLGVSPERESNLQTSGYRTML